MTTARCLFHLMSHCSFGKHVEQNIKTAFLDRIEDHSDKSNFPITEFLKTYCEFQHLRMLCNTICYVILYVM